MSHVFNFIRWMSDIDVGAPFIGVAQFVPDPRTGEALSASINIADFPLKEYVAQRLDAYLQTIMCHASKVEEADGVTAWNPGADGAVREVIVAADGAAVYVGGAFANAGGAARPMPNPLGK